MIQVAGFSFESGVGYYAAKKQIGIGPLVGFSFIWSVIATSITALVFVPLYEVFTKQPAFAPGLIFAYVGGNLLISFGNAICFSGYRFVLPHVIAIVINVGLSLLLWSGHASNITAFYTWYACAFLLQGVVLIIIIITRQKERLPVGFPTVAQLKLLYTYASHAFLANLLFFLLNRVDYLFVRHYCAPSDLGNYIQVSKIAQLFFMLPSMIATVLFPVIAAGGEEVRKSTVEKISVTLGAGYAVLLLLAAIISQQLFPWIFGHSFSAMYIPFVLQSPGIVAVAMIYPYAAYNSAHNRIRLNTSGTLLGLVILLIGDSLLVPYYGIRAAASVSSAGYCSLFAFLVYTHKKKTDLV